jgi:hypothetical protein
MVFRIYGTLKGKVLDTIMEIREEIGMDHRVPAISRISYDKDNLYIECEDRADKSIVIGTGGWVVGKLAGRLNFKEVKVESRLDNILRTKELIKALRLLKGLENKDFIDLSRAIILGKRHNGCKVHVLGEEMIWACSMLDGMGCSPVLLHTGFIHDNVKEAYAPTEFYKVGCPTTSYEDRLEDMIVSVMDDDKCKDDFIFMGYFKEAVKEVEGSIMVDPMEFYCIDYWQARRLSKRRFKTDVFDSSDANKIFLLEKVLGWCDMGLIEPNDAARLVQSHWPLDTNGIEMRRSEPDPLTNAHRIKSSLARAKDVSEEVHCLLRNYISGSNENIELRSLVAWSGGIDSSACIQICRMAGLKVDPITVNMPFIDLEELRHRAGSWDLKPIVLELPERYNTIQVNVEAGNVHPCGQCSSMIVDAIKEYAIENGYELLIFGDLLSVGAQSVIKENGLLLLSLPAALSIPKRELIALAGLRRGVNFGCPLVNAAHKINRDSQRISIQRVLRELRAKMIDTEMAFELIKDIKNPPERYLYYVS